MSRPPRALVVTHEASLSGAPRIAELVAQSLGRNGYHVQIISRRPGEMVDDLSRAGRFRIEPFHRVRRRLAATPGLGPIAIVVDTLLAAASILFSRAGLVYLNSTASVAYLRAALLLHRRVILHSHESAAVASLFLGPAQATPLLHRAELVACSPSVTDALAELAGVPASRVLMLPSVPDAARVTALAGTARRTQPRPDAADRPVVIGCVGSVERRKGADLWPRIAELVRQSVPDVPVRFVWVGGYDEPALVAAGGKDVFIGPRANPYAEMRDFDIAALPSRDDPFPLVVLEAMVLGKPVVAFGVGGVPVQIGDAGVVVHPGDVDGFAKEIATLVDDPVLRYELGRRAADRAREVYSTEAFSRALMELVRSGGRRP